MIKKSGYLLIIVLLSCSFICLTAQADSRVYWADKTNAKIYRARIASGSGSTQELALNLSAGSQPESLVVDDKNAKLYWSEKGTGKIRRSNLDGSNVEEILDSLNSPTDITFDQSNQKIYWIENSGQNIKRADVNNGLSLNNSSIQIVDPSYSYTYSAIAFDNTTSKLYFAGKTVSNSPFINYSSVSTVPITTPEGFSSIEASGLASSLASIYWFTPTNLTVNFADLTLSSPQVIHTLSNSISRLAYGPTTGTVVPRLFWSDPTAQTISYSLPTASSTVKTFTSVAGVPSGVAVDCGIGYTSSTVQSYIDDCTDFCPDDTTKTSPGYCGCGSPEDISDSDADGVPDCIDFCPTDAANLAPPVACNSCFSALDPEDIDFDSFYNCLRTCRSNLAGTPEYDCGCGDSGDDDDGDTIPNCSDGCPDDPRKITADQDSCACGLIENISEKGAISCSATRPLAPGTPIEAPPVIQVTNKSVKVIMEKFKGISLKKIKKSGDSIAYEFQMSQANGYKLTLQYAVTVKKTGGKKSDVRTLLSKKNSVTFKGLKPGNYTSTYRVNVFKDGKLAGKTSLSPVANFTIS